MRFEAVERKFSPSDPNPHGKLPWVTICDGMPTMRGCWNEIETTRPYKRPGKKASGWELMYGLNDDGTEDKTYLLAFCPSCAEIVRGQK